MCNSVDCLEGLVPEMTYYVSSGTLNSTHSRLTCGNIYLGKKYIFYLLTKCRIEIEKLYRSITTVYLAVVSGSTWGQTPITCSVCPQLLPET